MHRQYQQYHDHPVEGSKGPGWMYVYSIDAITVAESIGLNSSSAQTES